MYTLKKLSLVFVGGAIALTVANPAYAISVTRGGTPVTNEGQESSVAGATTITLDNGQVPTSGFAIFSNTNSTSIVQGSVVNDHATPANDITDFLTISPTNDNVAGNTGTVTINFAAPINYFGLYWGSVDTYNSIGFYDGNTLLTDFSTNGQTLDTSGLGGYFGGALVPQAQAVGSWTSAADNTFVNFFANPGESFTSVVLQSTGIAFESDNFAYVVGTPEPSSILGLLILGALSAGTVIKGKSKSV